MVFQKEMLLIIVLVRPIQGIVLHLLLALTTSVSQDLQVIRLAPHIYCFNDTLWDGVDCNNEGTCCDNTAKPWFYRQLDRTIQDDIEARICVHGPFSGRSTLIDQLELYIQLHISY